MDSRNLTTGYAPIVISVYDRVAHLRQCVDSLKKDPVCRQSDLFVVSDAAHTASYECRIEEVRESVSRIEGFRSVTLLTREKNLGSFRSVKGAIDDVLGANDRLIFLEDDNVVAPNFLEFLNDGLAFYRDDPSIFSVSGYSYPVQIPASYTHDVFKWQGFSAWGVGLWADRWRAVRWDYAGFDQMARDRKRQLDRIGEHLYRYMSYDVAHGRFIIDTLISYHLFVHTQYSIFPVVSRVRNTGHDGTGEHGGVTDRYLRQQLDAGRPYQFLRDLQPDDAINGVLRRHFRTPLRAKALMALARLFSEQQRTWIRRQLPRRRQD